MVNNLYAYVQPTCNSFSAQGKIYWKSDVENPARLIRLIDMIVLTYLPHSLGSSWLKNPLAR